MMQTTVQNIVKPYKEMVIDSSKLEVPRNTYQRDQKSGRSKISRRILMSAWLMSPR